MWFLEFKNGERASFWTEKNCTEKTVSPLERFPNFDHGDYWSVDIDDFFAKRYGLQADPKDNSFYLVPKSLITDVVWINV